MTLYISRGQHPTGQHLHVDAVVDNRDPSFDIQLFYYPSEVKPGAGGTRFIPGSHLRFTRAEGVSRYQKSSANSTTMAQPVRY